MIVKILDFRFWILDYRTRFHARLATTGPCVPNPKSKIQNPKLALLAAALVVAGELHAGEAAKWQAEWDRTVRAAEQEGQVAVSIGGYGAIIDSGAFKKPIPRSR